MTTAATAKEIVATLERAGTKNARDDMTKRDGIVAK